MADTSSISDTLFPVAQILITSFIGIALVAVIGLALANRRLSRRKILDENCGMIEYVGYKDAKKKMLSAAGLAFVGLLLPYYYHLLGYGFVITVVRHN